jgi:hypothetical protein
LPQPSTKRIYNTIIVIVYRLTKVAKFRPIEESIIIEELAYKVDNILFSKHRLLEEFITNRDKLFILVY